MTDMGIENHDIELVDIDSDGGWEMTTEAMVRKWLEKNYGTRRDASGYAMKICADYRDEMDTETAINILGSDDPEISFYEELGYMYDAVLYDVESDLIEECAADLGVEEDDVRDAIYELIYPVYPADHFLKQEFRVPIMVDTGAESNVDFTLNGFDDKGFIDQRSGIAWLIEQQGHRKSEIELDTERDSKSEFVNSTFDAVNFQTGHISTLTFLATMTLEQLIKLNSKWKPADMPGTITISKDSFTLLFSPWDGAGSDFIELERDVELPVNMIWKALPDCPRRVGGNWGVDETYGLIGKAWRGQVTINE